jgi:hypothetical protein
LACCGKSLHDKDLLPQVFGCIEAAYPPEVISRVKASQTYPKARR